MVAEQGNEELEGGDVGAEVGLGVEVEGGTCFFFFFFRRKRGG